MEFSELKKSLNNGLRPMYLFEGGDSFLRQRALFNVKEKFLENEEMNLDTFTGKEIQDYPDDFYTAILKYPFFGEKRFVVVNDYYPTAQDLKTSFMKSVFEELPDSTCLIFVNEKANANLKKLDKITYVDCSKISDNLILAWILSTLKKANKVIDVETATLIMDYCLRSMTRINTEISKLIAYVGENTKVTIDDVKQITVKENEYQVFEITDNLSKGNFDKVLQIIQDMRSTNDDVYVIFSTIYSHFRRMFYAALSNATPKEIADKLGVKEFSIIKAKEQSKKYKVTRLMEICNYFGNLDGEFKSGEMTELNAFWNGLFKILLNV